MPSAGFNQVHIEPWRTAQRSVPATLCWVLMEKTRGLTLVFFKNDALH